jgi:hypothetical protein
MRRLLDRALTRAAGSSVVEGNGGRLLRDAREVVVVMWVSKWTCLRAAYDSRDDLFAVALDRTDHLIRQPREILVEEGASDLATVAVIDAEGARQIVRLKDPLMLPAAGDRR